MSYDVCRHCPALGLTFSYGMWRVYYLQWQFIVAGSIEFAYKVENSGAPVSTFNGLEFFIDGIQSPIPYHPLSVHKRHGEGYVVRSFEVPSGDHTFVWNYHQEPNVAGIATMAHITVTGSTNGGAVVLTACGPGTASRNNGAIVCEKCPPGTFSSDANNDHVRELRLIKHAIHALIVTAIRAVLAVP